MGELKAAVVGTGERRGCMRRRMRAASRQR